MLKDYIARTVLACAALVAPLRAVAQQAQPTAAPPQWYWGPGPWHMWGDSYGWNFWWMGPVMMILMMLACAAVIYFLFAHRRAGGGMRHGGMPWHMGDRMSGPPTHSALQILNERFAKGEIQKEEYEDKKSTILSAPKR